MSADEVFALANWLLVGSLVLGVVSTYAIVMSGRSRDAAAKQDVAHAREAAAKANERAAQLEKDAADARLETERLKGLMAWRRISLAQHDKIVAALRGKVTGKIWVEVVDTDPEAAQFHADIWKTLEDAGLSLQWFSGWERAVGLKITNGETPEGRAIKEAFGAVGIPFEDAKEPGLKQAQTQVEIIVGSRPPEFYRAGDKAIRVR